jgi:CubicO group peptidase (beta-lactamase class C family)
MKTTCTLAAITLLHMLCANAQSVLSQTATTGAPTTTPPTQTIEDKVDAYVDSLPEAFSGTVLMAVGDDILINKGYGLASRSYGIPADADTKYLIGSITKQFTAVLALRLAERGLLDLNATVDTYLPYYPEEKASKITVHHLLSHTSGIPHHYTGIPQYIGGQDQVFHSPREYLRLFWNADLVHEPGERFTYTSPGYYLLGVVMETVTGKSYAELLKEYIFNPLRMNDTSVDNNLTVLENIASGYMKGLGGLVLAGREEESNRLAAGDLITTTGDLYRFQRTLGFEGDDLLSEEYKELLLKPQAGGNTYVGGRFAVPHSSGEDTLTVLTSGGSSYGFNARVDRIIELDAVLVVLSNIQSGGGMPSRIIDHLGDLLLEELDIVQYTANRPVKADAQPPVTVDRATLACYDGFYEFSDSTIAAVIRWGDVLFRQLSFPEVGGIGRGVSKRDLIPRGVDTFDVDGRPGLQWRFAGESDGIAQRLEVLRGGAVRDTGRRMTPPADLDLSQYEGAYFSVELQRTYHFAAAVDHLTTPAFLGVRDEVFVPLRRNLFAFAGGFLVFHRDADGEIRDFRLQMEGVAEALGSRFVRK